MQEEEKFKVFCIYPEPYDSTGPKRQQQQQQNILKQTYLGLIYHLVPREWSPLINGDLLVKRLLSVSW